MGAGNKKELIKKASFCATLSLTSVPPALHICILHHQPLTSILVMLLCSSLWILCTHRRETREITHLNYIMLSGFQKCSIIQAKPLSFVPLSSCQPREQIFINLPPPPFSFETESYFVVQSGCELRFAYRDLCALAYSCRDYGVCHHTQLYNYISTTIISN